MTKVFSERKVQLKDASLPVYGGIFVLLVGFPVLPLTS